MRVVRVRESRQYQTFAFSSTNSRARPVLRWCIFEQSFIEGSIQVTMTSYIDKVRRSIFHNVGGHSFWYLYPNYWYHSRKQTHFLHKELTVVNHSFLQICSNLRFATVELHEPDPRNYTTVSSSYLKADQTRMLSSVSANSQQLVSLQAHAHSWRPNQHSRIESLDGTFLWTSL